jgi:pyruvate dehydrogenase E2 component (dihydrolipoamide acetyltransferase)
LVSASHEFRLADVGEGLHEAEVKRWLVRPGDRVALDQPLVEIETDKAVVELPSPVAGVVTSLGADEGAILHVGDIVAVLEPEGAAPASSGPGAGAASTTATATTPAVAAVVPPDAGHRPSAPDRRALATPAVRKLARDRGVDINLVTGSGPGGRVLVSDVEEWGSRESGGGSRAEVAATVEEPAQPAREPASAVAPAASSARPASPSRPPAADSRLPLRGLRRRIAQTMTQAWTTIPHITGFDEVEVSALVAMRDRLKPLAEARGLRLTYLPFIVKAAAIALREHPIVNASLDEGREEIVLHGRINIGVATATGDGLIVPVLRDVEAGTLLELQQAIDGLTERARARTSTPKELHGGTFTITNFGALGGWQAAPIIRPGEAAILGVGRIQPRPWVVEGRVEPRPVLALSLAADHRLIDGDVSTAFLARVGALLSDPALMLLELR